MNDIFKPHMRKFILVFFFMTFRFIAGNITFSILQKHQHFVKKKKCVFGQSRIEYLGHIVFRNGVEADPSKIRCIVDWPIPANVIALKRFLGLVGYYRKFVPGYGKICQPVYQLTKRDNLH